MQRSINMAVAALAAWAGFAPARAATLENMRQRSQLIFGVSQGFAGLLAPDSRGEYSGLDADYRRAVAAAVLGDATKLRFFGLTAQNRFTALQAGYFDVLFRNSTQTFQRGNTVDLLQLPVNF